MKTQLLNIFIALFLFTPVAVFSQTSIASDQDMTGVWKGTLYNDTTQQYVAFELAVSKDKGKLTGYSYTQFENTDKTEWIVKKVKIKQKGEQLIIEDVDHIANTFNEPPPRGVRWMGMVNFSADDTSLQLQGKWSTSRTKEYSSATGSIRLKRAVNYPPLTIMKRLHELDLDETLSFVIADQNRKELASNSSKPTQTKQSVPNSGTTNNTGVETKAMTEDPSKVGISSTGETAALQQAKTGSTSIMSKAPPSQVQNTKPEVTAAVATKAGNVSPQKGVTPVNGSGNAVEQAGNKPNQQNNLAKAAGTTAVTSSSAAQGQKTKLPEPTKQAPPKSTPAGQEVVAVAAISPSNEKTAVPATQSSMTQETTVASKNVPETTSVSTPAPLNRINEQPIEKEVIAKTDPQKVNTPIKAITMDLTAAANVSKRTITNTQEVFYQSDSLILSLYDNGEVDGDTVSVLLNGNIIFAKQGLTTRANSKVIYISPDTPDSLMLVMYAENLGSIPPNTGLLVVRDGEKIYDLRFRADLQSNAAIILRRKRR